MGVSFNIVLVMNVYILIDCVSWLKFGNKGDFVILFEGDFVLFN